MARKTFKNINYTLTNEQIDTFSYIIHSHIEMYKNNNREEYENYIELNVDKGGKNNG